MVDFISLLKSHFLECALCVELYDETTHIPLILRCNHTFCSFCLTRVMRLDSITCPLCNKMHYVGFTGLTSLQKDNTRRDLASFIETNKASYQAKQPSQQFNASDFFKEFPFFIHGVTRVSSVLKISWRRKYVTAVCIAILATFIAMSLFSFSRSDQEFKISRSNQFPYSVVNDNSTGLWPAGQVCGTQIKLAKYDGISGYNIFSNFTRSIRLEIEVTINKKGSDTVEPNKALFDVDLISHNINMYHTYEHAQNVWVLRAFTCSNKYSICMKTKHKHLTNEYFDLDSSQNILTGKFIIILSFDANNGTHILLKSGNGRTILQDTASIVNVQPVFTVYQSDDISLVNISEIFIDVNQVNQYVSKLYFTEHNRISNIPAWADNVLNCTTYIFESLQLPSVENKKECFCCS